MPHEARADLNDTHAPPYCLLFSLWPLLCLVSINSADNNSAREPSRPSRDRYSNLLLSGSLLLLLFSAPFGPPLDLDRASSSLRPPFCSPLGWPRVLPQSGSIGALARDGNKDTAATKRRASSFEYYNRFLRNLLPVPPPAPSDLPLYLSLLFKNCFIKLREALRSDIQSATFAQPNNRISSRGLIASSRYSREQHLLPPAPPLLRCRPGPVLVWASPQQARQRNNRPPAARRHLSAVN